MLRHFLRQSIPSLFHRRLLLLGVLFTGTMGLLAVRAATMTTGKTHLGRKQQVEGVMVRTRYAPALRGKILDRNGVVLAEDRPGWNIAVHYSVLSGAWAKDAARRTARSDPAWGQSSDDEREELLHKAQETCAKRLDDFWKRMAAAAKVDPQALYDRQDAVVRKVSQLREAQFHALWQKTVAETKDDSPEAYAKLSRDFLLAEEKAFYPVLSDVGEEARLAVQDIIDAPEVDDDAPAGPVDTGEARPKTLWQKLGFGRKESDGLPRPQAPVKTETPWRQVEVQLVRARRYPCETAKVSFDRSTLPGELKSGQPLEFTLRGIGMHVLGYTRKAGDADLKAAPFKTRESPEGPWETHLHGLQPGDFAGAMGIEKAFEDDLRGTCGEIQVRRSTSALAENRRKEPKPGRDVQLSIDIKLQTRVEAAMSREVGMTKIQGYHRRNLDARYYDDPAVTKGNLDGAAVVLDAATGEVLAAACAPGIPLEDLQGKIGDLWADKVDAPMTNRVSGMSYQPGSVMKPLVLAAAITEGVYRPGEIVDIPGYPFKKSPKAYRDFQYVHQGKPWGQKGLDFAIAVSSSPPFVMLAQTHEDWSGKPRLGPTRWFDWLDCYGFGHPTDAGLPKGEDWSGYVGLHKKGHVVPTPEVQACVTAMGQGPIAATPLQIAAAYYRMLAGQCGNSVSFLKRPAGVSPKTSGAARTVSADAIAYVLQGMGMAPTIPEGSLRAVDGRPIFDCPGVKVWGKSGTAQVPAMYFDEHGEVRWHDPSTYHGADRKVRAGDHAWAAVLCAPAGETRPRFIIITMLEYGGSGGRAAGPIANQVIHALKAEGYLERAPKAPTGPSIVNPKLAPSLDNAAAGEPSAATPADPAAPEATPIDASDGTEAGGSL